MWHLVPAGGRLDLTEILLKQPRVLRKQSPPQPKSPSYLHARQWSDDPAYSGATINRRNHRPRHRRNGDERLPRFGIDTKPKRLESASRPFIQRGEVPHRLPETQKRRVADIVDQKSADLSKDAADPRAYEAHVVTVMSRKNQNERFPELNQALENLRNGPRWCRK